ncbi:MAG: TlpA disulfide reductase family protein [Marmoricola sp.]
MWWAWRDHQALSRRARQARPGRRQDSRGEEVSLADFKGQVVVLNVWGSWCPPCRKEAPLLAQAARTLEPEGVAFLGINTRDSSTDQGLAFQKKYDVPTPRSMTRAGRPCLLFVVLSTPTRSRRP